MVTVQNHVQPSALSVIVFCQPGSTLIDLLLCRLLRRGSRELISLSVWQVRFTVVL